MKLCDYPTPKQILDNEKRTLRFLKSQPDINSYFRRFHDDVCSELARLDNIKHRQYPENLFQFDSYMDIKIDGQMRRVFIGGIVRLGAKNVVEHASYSIAICNETSKSKVLRRFHFDFDLKTDSSGQSEKPLFHLQFGGELSPRMIREGFTESEYGHIESWLSLPRIIHMPMSFIFLVFLVIKELDEEHSNILCKPGWNARLRDSEELMLKDFFSNCCKAINNQKSVLMDCFY